MEISAQESWQIEGKSITALKGKENIKAPPFASTFTNLKKQTLTQIPSLRTAIVNPLQTDAQPKGWSYQELGLFCKLEVKMEKAFKMPVKFRLGEVQYVEKMEGKKGYVIPKSN